MAKSDKNAYESEALVCPACGKRYNDQAKFCGNDGSALVKAGASSEYKVCSLCKNQYPPHARFCPIDASILLLVKPDEAEEISMEVSATAVEEILAPPQNILGRTIASKYRFDELIGEGGMAEVYRATHVGIEKPVVIKLMHAHVPSMKNAVLRFEQECKVTAKINHPNVVSVFDSGVLDETRPYLVMEYINGKSLRAIMQTNAEMLLNLKTTCKIISQAALGLAEAHKEGIIHRDLKPENIMLKDDTDRPDWVKLLDFGIAHLKQGGQKLTATGVAVGTVDYMSPEYLSDKPVDQRSDIYAFGIILFELLSGRCPFQSDSLEAVMAKHLWTKPLAISQYRPDILPGSQIEKIIERCLEKEPDARFQSALEFRAELEKV